MVTESGCQIWTAGTTRSGYGVMYHDGKLKYAHRLSWEEANGESAGGRVICHKCDTPSCINPTHLYAGSHKDNASDMMRRGRNRGQFGKGEKSHKAKLTNEQVIEIRAANGTHREIGARFGIAHTVVTQIKNRKAWGHVQ